MLILGLMMNGMHRSMQSQDHGRRQSLTRGRLAPRFYSEITIRGRYSDTQGDLLLIAIVQNQTSYVKELLESGADVNSSDTYGETALFKAVRWGSQEITKLLLERGAGVTRVNYRGETVFTLAVQRADVAIAKLLISYGARVSSHLMRSCSREFRILSENARAIYLYEQYIKDNNEHINPGTASWVEALALKDYFVRHILKLADESRLSNGIRLLTYATAICEHGFPSNTVAKIIYGARGIFNGGYNLNTRSSKKIKAKILELTRNLIDEVDEYKGDDAEEHKGGKFLSGSYGLFAHISSCKGIEMDSPKELRLSMGL